MAQLEVRGCTVDYGGTTVLDGADLSVPSGSMHALLGPSGSGKTTLLRAIAGFVRPSAGTIELGGRPLIGVDPARRGIGVVFQSYALFPHLDVATNVGFGLEARRVPRDERLQRVRDVLALVGLQEYGDRKPSQLSGGQQQRVALARALVIEPDVLLLDEPLSALDRKIRGEVQRELKRIHQQTGVTAVIVTHDQDEALFLADELTILDGGRVRQVGAPTAVYEAPLDPFVADFLGSTNILTVPTRRDGARTYALLQGLELELAAAVDTDEVTIGLRPERIGISRGPASGTLPATVDQVDFAGPLAFLTCRLADGTVLDVTTWGQLAPTFSPQQAVWLRPDADAVRTFEEPLHAADR